MLCTDTINLHKRFKDSFKCLFQAFVDSIKHTDLAHFASYHLDSRANARNRKWKNRFRKILLLQNLVDIISQTRKFQGIHCNSCYVHFMKICYKIKVLERTILHKPVLFCRRKSKYYNIY